MNALQCNLEQKSVGLGDHQFRTKMLLSCTSANRIIDRNS